MKKKKLTERQQVRKLIEESNLPDDDIEEALSEIFKTVAICRENHPNVTLKQACAYAYIAYVNKKIGE